MHQYFHTNFGFCLWDLAALLVLVVMVVALVVHASRQKKRLKDFEEELSDQQAQQKP